MNPNYGQQGGFRPPPMANQQQQQQQSNFMPNFANQNMARPPMMGAQQQGAAGVPPQQNGTPQMMRPPMMNAAQSPMPQGARPPMMSGSAQSPMQPGAPPMARPPMMGSQPAMQQGAAQSPMVAGAPPMARPPMMGSQPTMQQGAAQSPMARPPMMGAAAQSPMQPGAPPMVRPPMMANQTSSPSLMNRPPFNMPQGQTPPMQRPGFGMNQAGAPSTMQQQQQTQQSNIAPPPTMQQQQAQQQQLNRNLMNTPQMTPGVPPAGNAQMMGNATRSPSIPPPPMAGQPYQPQQQGPPMAGQPDVNGLSNQMNNMYLNQQQQQFMNQNPSDQFLNNQRSKRVYNQPPPSQPMQSQPPQPQPPQGKPTNRPRIDPNQVPNSISVEEVDQELYNQQPYLTSSKSMPPLVTTEVKVIDDGNCSPRFMRLTTYNIPSSEDLHNSSMLPLGLIVQPLAEVPLYEEQIPLIDNGEEGPIRCRRCKGYINPGVAFIDGGRRFICNLCGCDNIVSDEYFCNLDMSGKRCDLFRRPELTHGTVEYVATKDFMERDPVPITYVFVIDVSFSASMNGLINKTCEALKGMFSQEVSQFPPGARVGFITFDRNVYFYNLKAELDQPQQLIVPDVDDIFIPINDGFLVDIEKSKKNILRLLDILPSMFENNHINDHALGAAFQAATIALQPTGGKISFFTSSIPSYGPGTLKNRQDAKLLGTDKERSLYEPQDNWYKQIAQKCATGGITVDAFLLPSEFIDVATVGILATLTGGNIYFYPQFDQMVDSIRYINDIIFSLRRSFGYDGLLRVRASDGLRVEEYLGNFYMTNSTDLELSGIGSDTAFGVTIKYDSKLNDNIDSAFQCALLYTTVTGQRRIRIHTLSVSSSSLLGDVFKYSELDTTLNYLIKQSVAQMFNQSIKSVRENLTDECVKILTSYRKHCATSTAPGQLILPESFKLLPLFILCILKLGAFKTDLDTPDVRVNALRLLGNINTSTMMSFLYPKIYNLTNLNEISEPDTSGDIKLPSRVRATEKSIESNGIYLLENGLQMILWIGHSVPEQYIKDIFNVESIDKVDSKMHLLPILNNPNSMKVRAILAMIQSKSKRFLELKIIRNQLDSLMDVRFNNLLVEDKTSLMSYVEFLCHIHRNIQNEISNS